MWRLQSIDRRVGVVELVHLHITSLIADIDFPVRFAHLAPFSQLFDNFVNRSLLLNLLAVHEPQGAGMALDVGTKSAVSQTL